MIRDSLLRDVALLREATDDQFLSLARAARLDRDLPAGEILFDVGDEADVLCVAIRGDRPGTGGPVRVRVDVPAVPPAKPMRFERVVENELFGEFEYFSHGMRPRALSGARKPLLRETRAQLLSRGTILRLPLSAMVELLETNAAVRQRFVALGAGRLRGALFSLMRRRDVDLDVSLAEHLLDLATDYATTFENYAVFTTRISQEEIAADLGISRRALTERLNAFAEAGLVRTTPLELLDIRRLVSLGQIGVEEPRSLVRSIFGQVQEALDAGNPALARAMALDFLRHFPSSPHLAFGAALAAARGANAGDALAILRAAGLADADKERLLDRILFGILRPASAVADKPPSGDDLLDLVEEEAAPRPGGGAQGEALFMRSETLALRSRLEKDRALASGRPDDARAAARLYMEAHEVLRREDAFPLVNAASLAALAGDRAEARALAERALAIAKGEGFWPLASRVEAFLVLGRDADALDAARAAIATEPNEGMLASTRLQLTRFRAAFGPGADAVLAILRVRPPAVHAGPLRPAKETGVRAPDETVLAGALDTVLAERRVGSIHGSLAKGAEILAAEAASRAGIAFHAILPFDVGPFVDLMVSKDPDGADWARRFEAAAGACASVTIAQPGKPAQRDVEACLRHGFRSAAAQAMDRAAELVAEPILLRAPAHGSLDRDMGLDADLGRWLGKGRLAVAIGEPALAEPSGVAAIVHGFAPVVFLFANEGQADSGDLERALSEGGAAPIDTAERRIKDGRRGIAAAMASIGDAIDLAVRLVRRQASGAGLPGRVICDFGAALDRSRRLDTELLARMAGASDLTGFGSDRVLATVAFAHEVRFAGEPGVVAVALGQRDARASAQARPRISPAAGVYCLIGAMP